MEVETSDRAVRARSCADMPVVVPFCNTKLSTCLLSEKVKSICTVSVVDSDSVCRPVSFLIVGDHHRDVELVESLTRQANTYVSTVSAHPSMYSIPQETYT